MPKFSQNTATGAGVSWECVGGLTKREAFALAAMQGLLANADPQLYTWPPEKTVACAIEHADALLAKLAEPQP